MADALLQETPEQRRDGVSWSRLLWVAPLTVIVALIVNLVLKTIVIALNPDLAEMGQLGQPMIILTLEGAILAVIVFALMVWLVPHPIRWFRIVGVIALLISIIPDIMLGLGGEMRQSGSSMVSPFIRFGSQFFPSSAGGGPRGGPPSGPPPALELERVLVLILLHAATAVVCIVLLTTLTREPESRSSHT